MSVKRAIAVLYFVSALTAAAPMAMADEPPHDLCDAAGHQYLLGRAMKDLPEAPAGEVWRLRSNRTGRTDGYRPSRLTIIWDEGSGRVVRLRCG
jgi:hypothetical protein